MGCIAFKECLKPVCLSIETTCNEWTIGDLLSFLIELCWNLCPCAIHIPKIGVSNPPLWWNSVRSVSFLHSGTKDSEKCHRQFDIANHPIELDSWYHFSILCCRRYPFVLCWLCFSPTASFLFEIVNTTCGHPTNTLSLAIWVSLCLASFSLPTLIEELDPLRYIRQNFYSMLRNFNLEESAGLSVSNTSISWLLPQGIQPPGNNGACQLWYSGNFWGWNTTRVDWLARC